MSVLRTVLAGFKTTDTKANLIISTFWNCGLCESINQWIGVPCNKAVKCNVTSSHRIRIVAETNFQTSQIMLLEQASAADVGRTRGVPGGKLFK